MTGLKELEFCRDEYHDYRIYSALAESEGSGELKEILRKFAEHERRHYEFWRKLSGECAHEDRLRIASVLLSRRLFGLTFTLKLLERHEEETIRAYKEYAQRLEGEARRELEKIIEEELEHERSFMSSVAEKETFVKYLGFIALGLADAIVEITGVHAGFLGATSTTLIAGIAGLIVGLSASVAMAGAAYLQAKHGNMEERLSPSLSAAFTGAAYIFAVLLLAAPYFLTGHMISAFLASLLVAVALVVGFTYYGSVVGDRPFARETAENLAILVITAMISYAFGALIGSMFDIREIAAP